MVQDVIIIKIIGDYKLETKKRTFFKALSYRTCVAISIFLAALALNYSAGFGLTFVILSYTVGLISFVVHERIWNLINWQRFEADETKTRSLTKTVTWRIFSLIILFILGMILGLSSTDAVEWTIVTNILFIAVHYVHERVWNKLKWGKQFSNFEGEPA